MPRKYKTLEEAREDNPEARIGLMFPPTKLPKCSCVTHIYEEGPDDYIAVWSYKVGKFIAEDELDDALTFLEAHHQHWVTILGNKLIGNQTAIIVLAMIGVSTQIIGVTRALLGAGPSPVVGEMMEKIKTYQELRGI